MIFYFAAPPERQPSTRGRKRMVNYKPRSAPSKRGRRSSNTNDVALAQRPEQQQPATQPPRFNEPAEKPDANMALKYTFGVNAWRHWVNIYLIYNSNTFFSQITKFIYLWSKKVFEFDVTYKYIFL